MADFQSCRRHTQLAQPMENSHNNHVQIDDVAPPDDNVLSASPGADESKLRPRTRRSLASFASCLGTHHRTTSQGSRSEWPSIDWSNLNVLNDKDGVYEPDTELMCSTVTQKLLADPSAGLSAQYNTFLLHLIEDYYLSKAAVQDLQKRLAEKNKFDQSIVDGVHGEISSQKAGMSPSLEIVNSNTLQLAGSVKELIATNLQKHDSTVQTPKPSSNGENNGQKHKQGNSVKGWSVALC